VEAMLQEVSGVFSYLERDIAGLLPSATSAKCPSLVGSVVDIECPASFDVPLMFCNGSFVL
jgi:hypothetical protein